MAGDKFLFINSGVITEKIAVQSSIGATNAGNIPALDSTGKLDNSLMPIGIGAETDMVACSENLSAGDFVNYWNSTGIKVRKADSSTSGKESQGFVLSAYTSGQTATVYRISQLNNQLSGMTVGAKQFLSATVPGSRSETVPTATGQTVQFLGIAKSATELIFMPTNPIVLA